MHRVLGLVRPSLVALTLVLATPVGAADWSAVADEGNITVVTQDEDGEARETTIWFAVVDGEAYIRTSRTTWGANMERTPDVLLRIAGKDHPVRSTRVTDDPTIETVFAAFRTKYGFSDRMSAMMRFLMGGGRLYHVRPR